MPAQTRTPRATWIEQGLRALGIGGPDAVRVEALAQALGVTKGGFYWHFDDRSALLAEMLDTWERVVSDDVIAIVEADGGSARDKLRRLFAIAVSMQDMISIELAIREWSRRDASVAARLRGLDNRRMDYMRALFGELSHDESDVEARCLMAFSLFVATDYIAAEHGGRSRADVVDLAIQRLLA
jgi:AcrR family transcriptional regulator